MLNVCRTMSEHRVLGVLTKVGGLTVIVGPARIVCESQVLKTKEQSWEAGRGLHSHRYVNKMPTIHTQAH